MGETKGFTIWLTGMSGAGKTTLAHYLTSRLEAAGRRVEVLDEEAAEDHLASGLGTSRDDRDAYTYRLAWVADMLSRNGVVAVVAATSPYREVRDEVRRSIGEFVEVFCDCPVETLIERDVKGLYKKALAGEIPNFTGITEPYEPPLNPEVMLDSSLEPVEDSARRIVETLLALGDLDRAEAKVALFGKGKAGAGEARRLARAASLKAARVTRSRQESEKRPALEAVGDEASSEAEPKRATRSESGRKPAAGAARKATGTRTVTRPARRAAKVASAQAPAKGKASAGQGASKKTATKNAGSKRTASRKAPAKQSAAKKAEKPATKKPAKAAAKKAPAKKAPAKKAPAKKAPAKKAPAKQGAAGKARKTASGGTAKKSVKKAPAGRTPAKKGPAKQGAAGKAKATAKKATAGKTAAQKGSQKAAAKKAPAKKAASKKAATKKAARK